MGSPALVYSPIFTLKLSSTLRYQTENVSNLVISVYSFNTYLIPVNKHCGYQIFKVVYKRKTFTLSYVSNGKRMITYNQGNWRNVLILSYNLWSLEILMT